MDFKKIFENAKPLEEFDGDVFKTVVEEVVIGGYNEEGIPDPYMLTFIFKTGLNTKLDGHKPPSKMKKIRRIKSALIKRTWYVECVVLMLNCSSEGKKHITSLHSDSY